MNELFEILKNNTIEDCFELEKTLPEYKSMLLLYDKIVNKDFFLLLVISNCVVCYTSVKLGGSYWSKFSEEVSKFKFTKVLDIYMFFVDFLPKITNNRKKILNKIQKIKDLKPLLDDMYFKQKYYFKNQLLLKNKISSRIDMLFNDHIAILAVRYYNFGSRIKFKQNIVFPDEFIIKITPNLQKIFDIYNKEEGKDIYIFYKELSEKLNIPEYHLGILLDNKYEI